MLIFVPLWWLIMLQIKSCGAMVKDLNPQDKGESFKSPFLQPTTQVFCPCNLFNLF
jgi:hypothetical protein